MNRRSVCAVLFLLVLFAGVAQAQTPEQTTVPRLVRFSGIVKDSVDKPATGSVTLTFALYSEKEGGSALWVETQSVVADAQGHYTVLLGANTADGLPLDMFVTGTARWLGVLPALSGVAEQPRVLLVGVPYAMKAADADTLGGKPASAFLLAGTPISNTIVGGVPTPTLTSGQASGAANRPLALRLLLAVPGTSTARASTVSLPSGTAAPTTARLLWASRSSSKPRNGYLGIGNTNPAGPFDLTGNAFMRGTLQLPPMGTATSSTGYNSQPFDLIASAYNSTSRAAANQDFRWQAFAVGNNSPSASATLNLLFGDGPISSTGLSIASSGIITFAHGQTFPGASIVPNTITVTPGTGLSGGGTVALGGTTTLTNAGVTGITGGTDITTSPAGPSATGIVTINVNTTTLAAGFASVFAAAAGSPNYIQNSFPSLAQQSSASFNISGNGTLGGTLSAATVNSTNPYQIGNANVLTTDGSAADVFVGLGTGTSNSGQYNTGVGYGALGSGPNAALPQHRHRNRGPLPQHLGRRQHRRGVGCRHQFKGRKLEHHAGI